MIRGILLVWALCFVGEFIAQSTRTWQRFGLRWVFVPIDLGIAAALSTMQLGIFCLAGVIVLYFAAKAAR